MACAPRTVTTRAAGFIGSRALAAPALAVRLRDIVTALGLQRDTSLDDLIRTCLEIT
jgi:hypothetical protein